MSTKMLLPSIKEASAHKVEKELLVAQFYPPRLLNATLCGQDHTLYLILGAASSAQRN